MPFADKDTNAMYRVGDVVDFDKKRADDVISRGLCSSLEKPVKKATKKVEKKED